MCREVEHNMNDMAEELIIKKAKEIYGNKYPEHEEQVMSLVESYRKCQQALKELNCPAPSNNAEYEELISQFDLYPKAIDKIFEENSTNEIKQIMITMIHYIGLAGEVGELGEKIKKSIRDDKMYELRDEAFGKELGDIEWYLTRLEADFDFGKNEILSMNFNKLYERLQKNKLHGSGDNREKDDKQS